MIAKDYLTGLLIITLWGFNFVVIDWGLNDLPPFLLAGCRFLLVAIIGSLFFKAPNIPLGWLALYALTISVGQFAFLFWAMDVGMSAGLASIVLQSQAIFTVIFSVLLLKEKVALPQIAALFIASIGLVIIENAAGTNNVTILGFGLTLLAASCWALGNLVNKAIANRGYKTGVGLIVWSSWLTLIPFFSLSYMYEGSELIIKSFRHIELSTVFSVFYLSIGATIIGFGLWGSLLAKYPAAKVTPLSLGVPIVGMLSAMLFLDESISHQQAIGIAVVILGLVFNVFHSQLFSNFLPRKKASLR